MGDSRFDTKESEESRVESISLSQIFEELCPIYMGYGMSYDEFWYGDAYRAKFYREVHDIKMKQQDQGYWLQGMYIYEVLCDVSPVLHAFCKSGTKALPYTDKPYTFKIESNLTEEEKQRKVENERLIAQIHFENWARAVAKQFENKQ